MTSTGRRGYVGVDRRWLADPGLSDGALRFMLWLESHTDEYLSGMNISKSAESLGWGRNRVKRTIEELEGLGLISTEQLPRNAGGTVTRFTLHLTEWSDGPRRTSAMVHDDARAVVHGGAPSTSTPSVQESNSGTPKPPASTEVEVVPEWEVFFNHFWQAYPRKTGKPAARRSMKAKYDHELKWVIADGTKAWTQYWFEMNTAEQYIPHPATFLNQERYNDTPPALTVTKESAMDIINRIASRDS